MNRLFAAVLTLAFFAAVAAPATLGCNRNRRARYTRGYYGPSYQQAYYSTNSGGYYNQYPYTRVAGDRYYNEYHRQDGVGSTGRAVLTVGAPAAIGAGVGAIMAGGKGAGIGALLGGGGGAIYYLARHNNHRHR